MMSPISSIAYAIGKQEPVTLYEIPSGAKIDKYYKAALRRFTNRFTSEKVHKAYSKELLAILRDCGCEVMSRLSPDNKDALKPKNLVTVILPDDSYIEAPDGTFEIARSAIHDRLVLPCKDGAYYIPHPSKSLDKNHDLGRSLYKNLHKLAGVISQKTKAIRKEADDARLTIAMQTDARFLHPNRRAQQMRGVRMRSDARRQQASYSS